MPQGVSSRVSMWNNLYKIRESLKRPNKSSTISYTGQNESTYPHMKYYWPKTTHRQAVSSTAGSFSIRSCSVPKGKSWWFMKSKRRGVMRRRIIIKGWRKIRRIKVVWWGRSLRWPLRKRLIFINWRRMGQRLLGWKGSDIGFKSRKIQ